MPSAAHTASSRPTQEKLPFDRIILSVVREEMSHLLVGEMHCRTHSRNAVLLDLRHYEEIVGVPADAGDLILVGDRRAVGAEVVAHDTQWGALVPL